MPASKSENCFKWQIVLDLYLNAEVSSLVVNVCSQIILEALEQLKRRWILSGCL